MFEGGQRALSAGVGVVALVIVVSMASRAAHLTPSTVRSGPLALPTGVVLGAMAVVVLLGLAIVLLSLRDRAKAPRRRRQSRPWANIAALALLIGLFTLLQGQEDRGAPVEGDAPISEEGNGDEVPPERPGPEAWPWAAALAAVSLAALGAAAWASRRRHPEGPTVAEELDDGAPERVGLGVDELARLPPRQAIIAAAALLESRLSAAGLPRRSSEAPGEYARRARSRLGPGDEGRAVVELARLAALARFSDHPVDEAMRASAIAALERATAALHAGASP